MGKKSKFSDWNGKQMKAESTSSGIINKEQFLVQWNIGKLTKQCLIVTSMKTELWGSFFILRVLTEGCSLYSEMMSRSNN